MKESFCLVLFMFTTFFVIAQEQPEKSPYLDLKILNDQQRSIWDMELKYWDSVKDGDVKSYIALYASDHISWPSFVQQPASKGEIEPGLHGFVSTLIEGSTTYDLLPYSIMVNKDVATVYYLAKWGTTTKEGQSLNFQEKFLHLWSNQSGSWKLTGGMSALMGK